MVKLVFPPPKFRIKEAAGKELIFDTIRKRWVRLSPEEWVRQNFIQYLVQVQQYPSTLIGVEKEIQLGELKKRFDVIVFDRQHQPWMMIECKAMNVELTPAVLQQLLYYNLSIPVTYLVITNGSHTYCYHRKDGALHLQTALPVLR